MTSERDPGRGPDIDVTRRRAPALEMRGITKRYPGVVANDDIDLDVRPGEIHALLGENGAGKTTLMNILYGLAVPDEGEILLDGKPVDITGPSDAIARGISMVHQHFMLVPVLTVAENIVLGEETMANPVFLDRKRGRPADRRARPSGSASRSTPTPRSARCRSAGSSGSRSSRRSTATRSILVLDEPTAVLTPQETEEIFAVLRRLAAEGHSIIFISHKLYEVLEIADRITVIRRGKVVGQRIPAETNEEDLAELMVGREVSADGRSRRVAPGRRRCCRSRACASRTTAAARSSAASTSRSGPARSSASPASPATARTSWSRRSSACASRPAARSRLDGQRRHRREARATSTKLGVAYVPADRHRFGLVLPFPLADNLVLTSYYRPPYARGHRCATTPRSSDGRGADQASSTSGRRRPTVAAGDAVGRQPAEGRRRPRVRRATCACWSSTSRPAASTSAASSSSTARRSPSATPGRRSCSSRPSSTRSSSCPTGSRSCTAASSSAIVDGRTADKNEVGLLMATGGRESRRRRRRGRP